MLDSLLSSVTASAGVKFSQRHSLFRSDASRAIRLSLRVMPKSGSAAPDCREPRANHGRDAHAPSLLARRLFRGMPMVPSGDAEERIVGPVLPVPERQAGTEKKHGGP